MLYSPTQADGIKTHNTIFSINHQGTHNYSQQRFETMSDKRLRNAIPYKENRVVLWTAETFGQEACTTGRKVKYIIYIYNNNKNKNKNKKKGGRGNSICVTPYSALYERTSLI